ncbi:MAG: ABC transporter ATP-binding protein [Christensenellales bacterium]|jgi:teichoic acid transport system ATP-binding protein
MKNLAIDIKNLTISYKELNRFSFLRFHKKTTTIPARKKRYYAVNDISFGIEQGKIIGIIGKNGSGKSTLLRSIAGIISPDNGTIETYGNSISLLAIGVGFQNNLSGRENIYLSGLLLGFSKQKIEEKSEEIIEFCELGEFIDKPVKTYSSGMYSKLAFSITAVLETDIMLVDEILSVGDAGFKKKSYAKMQELISHENRTVIIVSHNLDTIESLCDTVLWLHEGKVRMYGDAQEVLPAYEEMFVKKGKK